MISVSLLYSLPIVLPELKWQKSLDIMRVLLIEIFDTLKQYVMRTGCIIQGYNYSLVKYIDWQLIEAFTPMCALCCSVQTLGHRQKVNQIICEGQCLIHSQFLHPIVVQAT